MQPCLPSPPSSPPQMGTGFTILMIIIQLGLGLWAYRSWLRSHSAHAKFVRHYAFIGCLLFSIGVFALVFHAFHLIIPTFFDGPFLETGNTLAVLGIAVGIFAALDVAIEPLRPVGTSSSLGSVIKEWFRFRRATPHAVQDPRITLPETLSKTARFRFLEGLIIEIRISRDRA